MLRKYVLIALCLIAAPAVMAESKGQITVTGEGRAYAVPDMAIVTMGATSEAKSAKEAMEDTSEITAAILDQLSTFDIAPRDTQTSDLSLHPVWSNRAATEGRPVIEGYQASNRITARIRDLAMLGSVLDAVLADGANQLGGLRFSLSEPAPFMNEARRNAVADARAKAELYAAAAGVELGALVSLTEGGAHMPRPEMLSMARAQDAGVPVAAGEAELRATVTLVYEISSP